MATIARLAGHNEQVVVDRRVPWRVPWYLWTLAGVGVLAAIHLRHPSLLHGSKAGFVIPGVVLALLVGAILWELPPAVMMCAAIALTIFSGNWGTLDLPGFPFVPDRILLVGALLAVLLRSPGAAHVPRARVTAVHILMLVTVVYAAASAVLDGMIGTNFGLLGILDRLGAIPFLMFLVAPTIFSTHRERNWLLVTLVILGAYLGLTAIFETLGPHALVFPRYIYAADAARNSGSAGGPFSAVVSEGFACYSCAVAAVIAFSSWRGSWRWLALAVAFVALLGSALSLERGVWIGVAAGSLALALAAQELRRWLIPTVLVAGAAVFAVLMLSPALHTATTNRVNYLLPVYDRQNQTVAALNMIQAKPLLGFGWANWSNTSTPYFRLAADRPLTGYPDAINQVSAHVSASSSGGSSVAEIHDTYLSYSVELGLVGAGLWLGAVLWGIGSAIFTRAEPELRPWKLGLLAVSICFLVICAVDPLSQNFVQLLLWTWAGVAVGGAGISRTTSTPPDRARASKVNTLSTSRPAKPLTSREV